MEYWVKQNGMTKPHIRRMDSVPAAQDPILSPLRRFGTMTSMKGIQRAVRTPAWSMRWMWILAASVGMTVTVLQVFDLTQRYLQYATVSQTVVDYNTVPPFPDVSICQLNPLSLTGMNNRSVSLEQYIDYMNMVKEGMDKKRVVNDTDEDIKGYMHELWEEIISVKGYLSNYDAPKGPQAHKRLEDAIAEVIVDCTWYNWQWSEFKGESCKNSSVSYFYSPEYMLCHTISLQHQDQHQQEQVRGLSILIYVEDGGHIHMPMFHTSSTQSVAEGVRVTVHTPQTLPDMKTGVSISPGTEAIFHVKPLKRVSLNKPYSECVSLTNFSDYTGTHWEFMDEDYGKSELLTHRYSPELCTAMCRQHWVNNTCHCFTPRLFIMKEMHLNQKICGDMQLGNLIKICTDIHLAEICNSTNNTQLDNDTLQLCTQVKACSGVGAIIQDAIGEINCSLQEDEASDCKAMCLHPCEDYNYFSQVTQARWPHESYQLAFYKQYIQPSSKGHKFREYGKILEMEEQGQDKRSHEELQKLDLIRRHYLQLSFDLDEKATTELRDTPALTWFTVLANLGGFMNLWAGITFYTLFEVLELVFYKLKKTVTRVQRKESNATQQTEVGEEVGELREIYSF